jgi:hypothetical protein
MVVNLWHSIELKLPLLLLILVVWWFIRNEPEDSTSSDDDGGTLTRSAHDSHPHRPRRGPGPRGPRRGPHGDPAPSAPPRVRTVHARSRFRERS